MISFGFTFTFEYFPSIHDPEMMWVHQDQHFSSTSSTWDPYSASFQPFFVIHVYRQEQSFVFRRTNRHSLFGAFFPAKSQRNFLELSVPQTASGCPFKFRSRGTTESSMFCTWLSRLCRGRRVHTSGHSDLGIPSNLGASSIITWVHAGTASAACPSQSGYLAAVIWDADERCSVKTASAPESSFTMPPRRHGSAIILL